MYLGQGRIEKGGCFFSQHPWWENFLTESEPGMGRKERKKELRKRVSSGDADKGAE